MSDDDLDLLTGPHAGELLTAALASAGGRLLSWRTRQVDHRPGSSTTACYATRVAWGDREREEVLAARTGASGAAARPGVLVLSDGAREVSVWRYPLDPGLPALRAACDREAVHALMTDLGLATGGGPGQVRLTTRSYRPGRRAVVEVRTSRQRLFLKVTAPDRVADLHRRHRLLRSAGVPVPRSHGWSDGGLLVLEALPGEGLRRQLRRRGAAACAPGDVLAVLHGFPRELLDLPRRPSWTDGSAGYARVVGAAVPALARRAVHLAGEVRNRLGQRGEPVVGVHGDLYEGQLLSREGRLSGVLDVDTAGPGHRTDDLACLLAHVEVLAQVHPEDAGRLRAAGAVLLAAFDAAPGVDRVALRLRTSGVLLSLATGPHRVQQPGWPIATRRRFDLAERWLAASRVA